MLLLAHQLIRGGGSLQSVPKSLYSCLSFLDRHIRELVQPLLFFELNLQLFFSERCNLTTTILAHDAILNRRLQIVGIDRDVMHV